MHMCTCKLKSTYPIGVPQGGVNAPQWSLCDIVLLGDDVLGKEESDNLALLWCVWDSPWCECVEDDKADLTWWCPGLSGVGGSVYGPVWPDMNGLYCESAQLDNHGVCGAGGGWGAWCAGLLLLNNEDGEAVGEVNADEVSWDQGSVRFNMLFKSMGYAPVKS